MVRGVAELPYDIVGAPVDLATMAMRPFGYKEEKPVMGSDWIKEKMTNAGIRPGPEADSTLQGFRTFGELGANLISPTAVARTGSVAKETLGKMKAPAAAAREEGVITIPSAHPCPHRLGDRWHMGTRHGRHDCSPGKRRRCAVCSRPKNATPKTSPHCPLLLRLLPQPRRLPQPRSPSRHRCWEDAAAGRPDFHQPRVPDGGPLGYLRRRLEGSDAEEQFLNQVKNKFRDYDVDRVELALASFGPKDKITPVQLREALSSTFCTEQLALDRCQTRHSRLRLV